MTLASSYIYLIKYVSPRVYSTGDVDPDELKDAVSDRILIYGCVIIYATIVFLNPFLEKGNKVSKELVPVFYVLFVYFCVIYLTYCVFNSLI